jgi:hypothetical protein
MVGEQSLLETLIDHCPGWGYLFLLLFALLLATLLAGAGLRMAGALLTRARRSIIS